MGGAQPVMQVLASGHGLGADRPAVRVRHTEQGIDAKRDSHERKARCVVLVQAWWPGTMPQALTLIRFDPPVLIFTDPWMVS